MGLPHICDPCTVHLGLSVKGHICDMYALGALLEYIVLLIFGDKSERSRKLSNIIGNTF